MFCKVALNVLILEFPVPAILALAITVTTKSERLLSAGVAFTKHTAALFPFLLVIAPLQTEAVVAVGTIYFPP